MKFNKQGIAIWPKEPDPSKGKWIVQLLGGDRGGFELSVVRSGNKHGQRSYGWFGPNKVCIASHMSVYNGEWHPRAQAAAIAMLRTVAENLAREWNEKDGNQSKES